MTLPSAPWMQHVRSSARCRQESRHCPGGAPCTVTSKLQQGADGRQQGGREAGVAAAIAEGEVLQAGEGGQQAGQMQARRAGRLAVEVQCGEATEAHEGRDVERASRPGYAGRGARRRSPCVRGGEIPNGQAGERRQVPGVAQERVGERDGLQSAEGQQVHDDEVGHL